MTRRFAFLLSLASGWLLLSWTASTALAQPGDVTRRRVQVLEDPSMAPQIPAGFTLTQGRAVQMLPSSYRASAGRPAILLTGYWPPTNEMVRRFSPSPTQNPQGWIGSDWEGRGYDIYAYFPEFVPPNCNNCGKGNGDLEVDYQDTSQDFWPIAEALKPIAIITFSRAFPNHDWEVEMNQYNRTSWWPDYQAPTTPTPSPPDATVPAQRKRLSALPVQDIVNAVNNAGIGVNAFICFSGDGGGFLSEFMAYHGVWYQSIYGSPAFPDWCIAAGHVHVGSAMTWATAQQAAEITVRTVIQYVDSVIVNTVCQTDLGFGGPGTARLEICGDALTAGGTAEAALIDAPPNSIAVLAAGTTFNPSPWRGGLLVPTPATLVLATSTDASGRVRLTGIPGGNGPFSAYAQYAYLDLSQPLGVGFSNAVRIDFLP